MIDPHRVNLVIFHDCLHCGMQRRSYVTYEGHGEPDDPYWCWPPRAEPMGGSDAKA